jgi:selenocysteine-specific elongation factor
VNLTGVAVSEIARGDVLTAADSELEPTYLLDARLKFEADEPEPGQRVQVHHGTRESAARLAWLGGSFWQLRLEQALIPARGDRVVIRQIAPPDTLGGGEVLDSHPRKHGPSRELLMRLERLARGEPEFDQAALAPALPDTPSPASALRLTEAQRALEQRLRTAGLEPPLDSELDGDDLAALRAAGRVVRVSRALHYHCEALLEARNRVIAAAERNGGAITLAQLRDELGTSRKFAQALLEHFDSERLTIRREDAHVLRRTHG